MAGIAGSLCERLIEWGVTSYGFPGDGINGNLCALRRHQDGLRFVQTRHEEMAAFMACGHTTYTGAAIDDEPAARAGTAASMGGMPSLADARRRR